MVSPLCDINYISFVSLRGVHCALTSYLCELEVKDLEQNTEELTQNSTPYTLYFIFMKLRSAC